MPNPIHLFALLAPTLIGAALGLIAPSARAQEIDPSPTAPPAKHDGVQITFLPPPMQGTLSLGIYDATGKLVRVLHREATEKDFTVGLNGFITRWDGKNDQGETLPAGKYHARGWTTGDLGVEGVAFHGNDWVKEDGPRFTEMLRFDRRPPAPADGAEGSANAGHASTDNAAARAVVGASGRWHVVLRSLDGKEHSIPVGPDEPDLPDAETLGRRLPAELQEGEKAIKWTIGFGGRLWIIAETPAGREVRCYSQEGEFLRRLAYRQDEPAPFDLAASTAEETVLLLEKNAREQRFRVLGQPEVKGEASAWKTIEQKRIVASDTFESVARDLGRADAPKAEAVVKIASKLNPLLQNARTELQAQVLLGADGVTLATADGLPLMQITEAKGLKWCALVPDGKALTLFQSDGAVVEEFRIAKPGNLMSFDAGEYTLKR